jgi:Tol biopolymer transport system component
MQLGPYTITAPIGAGGMGEVYRARDERLQRDVAIKVLPFEFATDPSRMARFAREAQLVAALSHPNIAGIYGLENSGGASALVMEFVDGATLAERIAAGALRVDEAVELARQIADALEAAHEKGIVHRDLKPANIKVTPQGQVKVLDFGLAKAMEAESAGAVQENSPTLTVQATRAGQIMGTAAYMAPEQARGKSVDRRADIWAFGVVLYEMLTGRSMFQGETVSDTLAAVLRAEIDLKQLPAETPLRLRRLVGRCLERDPKRRLRDIGDAWIEFDAPEEAAAARVTRRWAPWIAAVVIAGAGVAWGVLHVPPSAPRPVVRFAANSSGIFVSVSRDGSMVAWSEGGGGALKVMLRRMDELDAKPAPGGLGGAFPIFSPDGQWIAFTTADAHIKKIPVTGGTPATVCDGGMSSGGAWLDDDTIVFSVAKGLERVSAAGGTPEHLTELNVSGGELAHLHPQALTDGRVLFTVVKGEGAEYWYAILDVKTKQYRVVGRAGLRTRYSPSGHIVYVRAGALYAMPVSQDRLEATGPETPVADAISGFGPRAFADYDFSRAGLLAYFTGLPGQRGTSLAWADRKGTIREIPSTQQLWGTGRLSPDGRLVANSLPTPGSGRDIWVFDIARQTSLRLTFGAAGEYPIWSPDGRLIVFGSADEKRRGLYSVPADGSGKPQLLLATERQPIPTSFTRDGKALVFTGSTGEKTRIFVLSEGGKVTPLHETSFAEGEAQISPDGKWVAYSSDESGTSELYVQPFPGPGAKIRISIAGGTSSRWDRSGRELYYRELPGPTQRNSVVQFHAGPQGLTVGTPTGMFELPTGTTWDIAPDGQRFLVELTTISTDGKGRMVLVTNWFDDLRRRAPAKK